MVITLRIAMIASFWPLFNPSGSAVYAYELSRHLSRKGIKVTFIAASGCSRDYRFRVNPNFDVILKASHLVVRNVYPISIIFDELRKLDVDVIHVHSYLYFLAIQTALFRRLLRRIPLVIHIHGSLKYVDSKLLSAKIKEYLFDPLVGGFVLKTADKVLSIARADIPTIYRKFRLRAEWLPNAVDVNRFKPPEEDRRFSKKLVVYIGRLEPWKGIEDLIRIIHIVCRQVSNVRFLIVGSGSMGKALKKLKAPIKVVDKIPYNRIHKIYQLATVVILPSYMEGAPNILLEAGASGVPVVATNVGDSSSIVKDNETGFIVEPGDVRNFADRVMQLLEDESLWRSMSRNAVEYIREKFSFDSVAQRALKIYSSLAK